MSLYGGSLAQALPAQSLHLFLRCRPEPDEWHWGLYLHLDAARGGHEIHVSNLEAGTWRYKEALTTGIIKSPILVLLHQVGVIPAARVPAVLKCTQAVPLNHDPASGFSCFTWVFSALGALAEAGFVRVEGAEAQEGEAGEGWLRRVELEARAEAGKYSDAVAMGTGPAGVSVSRVCKSPEVEDGEEV